LSTWNSHEIRGKQLFKIISEEIEWYWRTRFGILGKTYLTFICLLALATSLFIIYILFHPLVYYEGFTLSGYVAPLHYDLRVAGHRVHYSFLDSLNVISVFTLIYAFITMSLSVLGITGIGKKWRSWIVFSPASTASSALLISLLYSLLRYASLDAIPTLPHTIIVTGVSIGEVTLNPPRTIYTWTYYLAWKPVYFFIAFNTFVAFTAGSLIILLLKPKTPVTQVKLKKKKELHWEGGRE